jgi:hypothetical protein
MEDPARYLMVWSMGSFHAVLLTLVLVLFSYGGGALAGQLGGLGSLAGAMVFLALWGLGVWTAGRALQGFNLAPRRPADGDSVFVVGILWGGTYGALFFLALAATFIGGRLVYLLPGLASEATRGQDRLIDLLRDAPGVLAFVAIGGLVAYVVGLVIGTAFGLLDLSLWAIARRLADGAIDVDRPAEPRLSR